VEEALFLTRFATKVKVIHRRDALRASKIMQERALSNPKIEFLWNRVVTDLIGDTKDGLKGVVLLDVKTNKEEEMSLDGLFIAIGHEPKHKTLHGEVGDGREGIYPDA